MRALFQDIRAGDLDAVRTRLDANPALVAATASPPPKKDDGQSTLQVAIKRGRFAVAHLLIDRGADVNFMETSAINRWNIPVLHDAIRAATFSSRFARNWAPPGQPPRLEMANTAEESDRAFALLQRLLELGADVHRLDSAGNNALKRAVLDARQVDRDHQPPELMADLRRVFGALLAAGADPEWVDARDGRRLVDEVEGTRLRDLLP